MKRSIFLNLLPVFLIAFVFTSCDKYDDGGNFSILTAKMRITNDWTSTSLVVQTGSVVYSSNEEVLSIKKDGTYKTSGTVLGISYTEEGTWEFNDDKTEISFKDDSGDVTTWTITKLKNNELKLVRETTTLGVTTTYTKEYESQS